MEDSYYHVYNRGVNKRVIFQDNQDYATFLNLLKRYLSSNQPRDRFGRTYLNLSGRLELLAYCLMPNHFHMLFYQRDANAIEQLMRRVISSYSVYFNTKNQRVGPLFQSRYKASLVPSDSYLEHISRYIHLNPSDWRQYEYSSLKFYGVDLNSEWVKPTRILKIFNGSCAKYQKFLEDYENYKKTLESVEENLANT